MLLLTLACGEQWGEAPCGAGAARREGGRSQAGSASLSTGAGVAEHGGEAGRALPELTQSAQKSQPPPPSYMPILWGGCLPCVIASKGAWTEMNGPLQAKGKWLLKPIGLSGCPPPHRHCPPRLVTLSMDGER